jgi:hypothetical protein
VTGWTLAVGGSALTAALAISFAHGIFHPYYDAEHAPIVAALAGAGVARFTRGDRLARVAGPLAVAGGVITSLVILGDNPGSLPWLPPVLVVVGAATAGVLACSVPARVRNLAIATAVAFLLIAPASWSVQTLGHATSGTFPTGGPATANAGFGGPGGRGGAPMGRGGFGGPPPGMMPGPGGGGAFGGNSASLTTALDYIAANGGGTLAVSSQSTAAAAIVDSDADIAGLGGFSGRESEVSVEWFAGQVRDGNIRWVLADAGGLRDDGRTGSNTVMAAVEATAEAVDVDGVTLYDVSGTADALLAAGS